MAIVDFFLDAAKELISGGKKYWIWVLALIFFTVLGGLTYIGQFMNGLIVTGMSDQVSWGFYVSNFTYLVGMAAAAVMVVVPTYIFKDKNARSVVILGEALAVAATVMCVLFVTVDMGRPERIWHMLPFIGRFNWPNSMLTWDVLVLQGYMLLNLFVPLYILYHRYVGKDYNHKLVFGFVVLSIFWAISIHTVTAFLFSSNTARPFWNTALTAPRFLASAFTAGPAFMIIAFRIIDRFSTYEIPKQAINMLALIVTVAMQINLVMVGAEIFTEFYAETSHSASAHYMFFGLNGMNGLMPWVYSAIIMNIIAVTLLMIHRTRQNLNTLTFACVLAAVGIWMEKGMGFVVPGFVPTPLGEVFEYFPTINEILIALGVWSIGMLIFTALVKVAIPIQGGTLQWSKAGNTA